MVKPPPVQNEQTHSFICSKHFILVREGGASRVYPRNAEREVGIHHGHWDAHTVHLPAGGNPYEHAAERLLYHHSAENILQT